MAADVTLPKLTTREHQLIVESLKEKFYALDERIALLDQTTIDGTSEAVEHRQTQGELKLLLTKVG